MDKTKIKLTWIDSFYQREIPEDVSEEVVKCYARVYILRLIGRFLFSSKGGKLVHAKWL